MSALQGEYSMRAAARLLRIDRKTMATMIADGRVRGRRTVTGRVWIPAAELVRLDPSLANVSRDPRENALRRLFG